MVIDEELSLMKYTLPICKFSLFRLTFGDFHNHIARLNIKYLFEWIETSEGDIRIEKLFLKLINRVINNFKVKVVISTKKKKKNKANTGSNSANQNQ